MKKERNVTPEKFQFEEGIAMYCIKHVPSRSIYIGVTTKVKMRMRNHVSKLRGGTHPCYPLQCVFNQFPDMDEWEPTILLGGEEYTKEALLELETKIVARASTELPGMIILNSYKNKDSHEKILARIEQRIWKLGLKE